jgi:hypothetical protein
VARPGRSALPALRPVRILGCFVAAWRRGQPVGAGWAVEIGGQLVRRHRVAEHEPLAEATSQLQQRIPGRDVADALGHHVESEVATEVEDRAHDRAIVLSGSRYG